MPELKLKEYAFGNLYYLPSSALPLPPQKKEISLKTSKNLKYSNDMLFRELAE